RDPGIGNRQIGPAVAVEIAQSQTREVPDTRQDLSWAERAVPVPEQKRDVAVAAVTGIPVRHGQIGMPVAVQIPGRDECHPVAGQGTAHRDEGAVSVTAEDPDAEEAGLREGRPDPDDQIRVAVGIEVGGRDGGPNVPSPLPQSRRTAPVPDSVESLATARSSRPPKSNRPATRAAGCGIPLNIGGRKWPGESARRTATSDESRSATARSFRP